MQNIHDKLSADGFRNRLEFYHSETRALFLLILVLLDSLLIKLFVLFFMDF